MVFGKLFSPGADKTKEESHASQSGKSTGSQARTEFNDPESKILKDGCPQTNQKTEGKNRDIQVQIFKIMMKLKAYIATMMKTRYQRKNLVLNSGGGAPEWARAMMEYLRKSTTSVRRTCKSLERKETQVQNDFLLYKDQQEKQSTDFKQSLNYTSEQLETLQREKADLTKKVNG